MSQLTLGNLEIASLDVSPAEFDGGKVVKIDIVNVTTGLLVLFGVVMAGMVIWGLLTAR